MSGHGEHDADHADGEHDHDDDHHAPPALEEPATPLWLTLLGLGLFLLGGILFVATRGDGKTTAELTQAPVADSPADGADTAAAPAPAPGAPGRPSPAAVRRAPPNPARAPAQR